MKTWRFFYSCVLFNPYFFQLFLPHYLPFSHAHKVALCSLMSAFTSPPPSQVGFLAEWGGAYLTELFSWQICFILLGGSLILGGFFSISWIANQASQLAKFTFSQILPLLSNKTSLVVLGSVFVMFFSFQAVLNTLPFYAKEMYPYISQNELGRLYLGYSIGIVVSLLANPIIKLCGGREKTIFLSLNLFALGLCVFLLHSLMWIYVGMFVMCFGSFIAHSVLNALNNSLNPKYKAASSGLYLSFYYTGGTLGSYLSSFIFELFGWQILIISLAITLSLISFIFYHHTTYINLHLFLKQ